MKTEALIPISRVEPRDLARPAQAASNRQSNTAISLDDLLAAEAQKRRGLRGWLHIAKVGRVLGLLTLYLFLDSYDIRASSIAGRLIACARLRSTRDVWHWLLTGCEMWGVVVSIADSSRAVFCLSRRRRI